MFKQRNEKKKVFQIDWWVKRETLPFTNSVYERDHQKRKNEEQRGNSIDM